MRVCWSPFDEVGSRCDFGAVDVSPNPLRLLPTVRTRPQFRFIIYTELKREFRSIRKCNAPHVAMLAASGRVVGYSDIAGPVRSKNARDPVLHPCRTG